MNKRISLTAQAHSIIQQHLSAGDFAIDATTGNGHDTLFLARLVANTGTVFGFDIQAQAIASTQARVESENLSTRIQLFNSSHHKMQQCIATDFHKKIKAIMFNLGYLPGSDKAIITQTTSTLEAIAQAITLLAPTGIITIAAYPGHAGGDTETDAIEHWIHQLDDGQYTTQTICSSEKSTAPRLYIIQKNEYLGTRTTNAKSS